MAVTPTSLPVPVVEGQSGAVARKTIIHNAMNALTAMAAQQFNVKDYGATGNGTTVDTAALTAAFAAGGNVYFPPGTYISSPFTIAPNKAVRGAGVGLTTLKLKSGSNSSFVTLLNAHDSLVTDLTLDGNKAGNTGSGTAAVLMIDTATPNTLSSYHLTVDRLVVINGAANGISVLGKDAPGGTGATPWYNWVYQLSNIAVESCEGYGLYDESSDNRYSNFYMTQNKKANLYLLGASSNLYVNFKCGEGGATHATSPPTKIDGANVLLDTATRCRFTNFDIQSGNWDGLYAKDCRYLTFSGVDSQNNDNWGYYFVNCRGMRGSTTTSQTSVFFNTAGDFYFDASCSLNDLQGSPASVSGTTDPVITNLGTTNFVRLGPGAPAYATSSRPLATKVGAGMSIYDTTLSKPFWSDGTNWKDASSDLIISASDNGVIGNGVADDGTALNALLVAAAAAGKTVQLAPNSVVRTTTAILLQTGTRLDLNGSTLKNASASTSGRLVSVIGKTNVQLYNGILDGDKASFATVTEQRHNVAISNSSRVTLRDIQTLRAKGDGVYVGDDVAGFSSDVTLINVWGEYNHRNGISITGVKGFKQFGGGYRYTSGTSPMSGCDIEPNVNGYPVEDIEFHGVSFDFNDWNGFIDHAGLSTAPVPGAAGGHRLFGCTFNGNGVAADAPSENGNGVIMRYSTDVSLVRCESRNNAYAGVRLRDTNNNIVIDCDITGNGWEGVRQTVGTTTDLKITGTVANNGTAGTYDGINLAATGSRAFIDVVATGNTRYGIRTLSTWTLCAYGANCHFATNTTGPHSLADGYDTRVSLSQEIGWRFGSPVTTTGAFATRSTGDNSDRFAFRVDGRLSWGTGAATADVTFERTAVGVVAVGAGHAIRTGRAVTGSRPSASTVGSGTMFYDTTLSKPIWSDGTNWKDATGATV